MASDEVVNQMVREIYKFKNRELMAICIDNHIAKSGNKADLQKRIINLIDSCVHDPNGRKFEAIQDSIDRVLNRGPRVYALGGYLVDQSEASTPSSSPSYSHSHSMHSPYAKAIGHGAGTPGSASKPGGVGGGGSNSTSGGGSSSLLLRGGSAAADGYGSDATRRQLFLHQGLQFKASPFYDILYPIGDIQTCEVMEEHRNSISMCIRASAYPELQRLPSEPSHRVLVFCSKANDGPQDILFPYHGELKVNTGEVKANLRGLKNKPGSTRPADITDHLRLKPTTYANTLEFTYALTSKRFYLAVYICKVYSATVLAGRIAQRSRITRESVVREITKQAQDPDIVATSYVLSLKCPLTYMRLALPVRATTCKHIQCFDATSYLLLQEQGPQWLCPVCSNPAPFDALAVDEYVKDIVENTASDLEQVTIDPDGTWHAGGHDSGGSNSNKEDRNSRRRSGANNHTPPPRDTLTLDDDLEILTTTPGGNNNNGEGSNNNNTSTAGANGSTPRLDVLSRDTTATPNRAPAATATATATTSSTGINNNNKRVREVVDLTGSDDEDDESQRPLKRQNVGFSTASLYSNPRA